VTIAGITFDFWDTLFTVRGDETKKRRNEMVSDALAGVGVDLPAEAAGAMFDDVAVTFDESWRAGVQYRFDHARASIVTRLGLDELGAARLEEAWLEAYRLSDLRARPDAAMAVHGLAEAGIRLAIVCDVSLVPSSVLEEHLRRAGLAEAFMHRAWSDEVGVYKPHAAIFRHAIDGLGITDPRRVAHVGDLRRTDVAGAREFGMTPVRYRGAFDDVDDGYPDAEHVIDDHRELFEVLAVGRAAQ